MFFEGAEKKLEIIVHNPHILWDLGDAFWAEVVSHSQATILSQINNDHVKAYLLSESSLFVWKDRLLMLTCGETKLVDAADFLIDKLGRDEIKSLIFQRKNEYRSHLQKSNFEEDVALLKKKVDGRALRFGKLHGHHNLVFHSTKDFAASAEDATSEFLMYDMDKEVSNFLTRVDLTKVEIQKFLKLEEALPGFKIDDYVFSPYGYSLNAIKDSSYYTIHVTPQETSAYVSFETNLSLTDKHGILRHFASVLKPNSFDVMTFNEELPKDLAQGYELIYQGQDKLSTGYSVDFKTYYQISKVIEKPHYYEN